MEAPDNIANAAKWDRARREVVKSGKEVTVEAVTAVYLRLGGMIYGQPETMIGVAEPLKPYIEAKIEEQAPARVAKKKK